jgi:hypothetical protein
VKVTEHFISAYPSGTCTSGDRPTDLSHPR